MFQLKNFVTVTMMLMFVATTGAQLGWGRAEASASPIIDAGNRVAKYVGVEEPAYADGTAQVAAKARTEWGDAKVAMAMKFARIDPWLPPTSRPKRFIAAAARAKALVADGAGPAAA